MLEADNVSTIASESAFQADYPEPRKVLYDALILDARSRQTLVSVRSLGSRGHSVAAMEAFGGLAAFSSRWCRQKYVCPALEGTEDYLKFLEQVLDEAGARVVIPTSDGSIELIRRYRERLAQRTHIALAQETALDQAVDKEKTLAIARELGLKIPLGVSVHNVDEVEQAIAEIGLPAVVKPVESWLGEEQRGRRVACYLVTTLEEAIHAVEALTVDGGTVLFQQFLSGSREAISFLYANGEVYARFAQWAKHTDPPLGGTSVLRQSIAIPEDIGPQAERLIRAIDLEGYSEVEFRRDGAGVPYLMEINPRLSASVELAVRAGVDFPHLIYQWALGGPIDRIESYRCGLWMRYLWGDISSTITSLREYKRPGVLSPWQTIFDFIRFSLMPIRYDYLDWQDLAPLFTAVMGRGLGGVRRLRNFLTRKGTAE